jgi:hypothetical protein
MKNLKVSILAIMLTSFAIAQEKKAANVDVEETVTVKTTTMEKDGKMVKEKVKTEVKKETPITFEEKSGELNREKNLSKVTKTVSVEKDWDPFYNQTDTLVYYSYDNSNYNFQQNETGFMLSTLEDDEDVEYGRATRVNDSNNYMVKTDNYTGIGYFNEKGNFIVRYKDVSNNDMIEIEYVTTVK